MKRSDWMKGLLYAESEMKRLKYKEGMNDTEIHCHLWTIHHQSQGSSDYCKGLWDYKDHWCKLVDRG